MKYLLLLVIITTQCQCQNFTQMELSNANIKNYNFLNEMYNDDYFPDFLVDKGKEILIKLCHEIETSKPTNLEELYKLTHSATYAFNELQNEFFENDSEIETMARESIGEDFDFIAKSYGFNADIEELIAPRNW